MVKKKKSRGPSAAEQAAAAAQAAAVTQANNLRTNFAANLSNNNNAPAVAAVDTGISTDVAQVGGSSLKRRRATGALSSQLGVNV